MKPFLALFSLIPVISSLTVVAEDDYHEMPNGWSYHSSCILPIGLSHDDKASLSPCPYPPKKTTRTPHSEVAASYYSDWSVYAQSVSSSGITHMSSTWTVPSKPANHGPASQSSVYIFNGLEDGGGIHGKASVILQPVLQYGKSGCLLNPAKWNGWYASSYVVDGNGRAHCASLIEVSLKWQSDRASVDDIDGGIVYLATVPLPLATNAALSATRYARRRQMRVMKLSGLWRDPLTTTSGTSPPS